VWFFAGKVIQLSAGEWNGEAAFERIIEMRSGEFTLDPSVDAPAPASTPIDLELYFRSRESAQKGKPIRELRDEDEISAARTPVSVSPAPARDAKRRGR